jgi:peptidoglycan/xylan/chitin deacetylase (PgdA/CDA1 family)
MNPAVAKACVAAGHEIAGHGYRYLDNRDLSPEQEKGELKLAIKAIQTTAGVDPQGWYVGRITPNSAGVVWEAFEEMGLTLKWESDYYGDDVPVWVDLPPALAEERRKTGGGPDAETGLLHIPYSYDNNDMKFHMAADGLGGASFFEYLRDAFDMLYEEGGKMMSVGIHPRIVGKPGRARQLKRFLDYIAEKPDVWVCTRAEIAQHWRTRFPYQPAVAA